MRYLIPLHFVFSAGGCVLAITLVLCSMIQYPAGAVLWDEILLIVCHVSVKQVKKMPYRQTKGSPWLACCTLYRRIFPLFIFI